MKHGPSIAPVQPSTGTPDTAPGRVPAAPATVPGRSAVERTFARAVGGSASPLPFRRELERAFGMSLADVEAYLGQADTLAPLGARAATRGARIAFAEASPDLHLVAHEVAHVLQQRNGSAGSDGIAAASSDAEHEADEVADHVVARSGGNASANDHGAAPPLRVKATSAGTVHLKRYGELGGLGKARVDARAEAEFAQKAEAFETGMAERIFASRPVAEVVHKMTSRVTQIVQAWAQHTGQTLNEVCRNEFAFPDGDKYYGAFLMSAKSVRHVLEDAQHQPLRKQLKLVYNAVRNNNLAKWLKVAADEMVHHAASTVDERDRHGAVQTRNVTAGFARDSGLARLLQRDPARLGQLQNIAHNEKQGGHHQGLEQSGAFRTLPTLGPTRSAKRYGANYDMPVLEQQTVSVGKLGDITTSEIRQLQRLDPTIAVPMNGAKPDKQGFRTQHNQRIPWEQGREGIDIFTNHPMERTAATLHARLDGGISGSTDLMMHAAQHLGFTEREDLRKIRLALVAWMILNRDHSFYEIMEAAEGYGVPFVRNDPKTGGGHPRPAYFYQAKDNFKPFPVGSLRDVLPERQFPGYFLGATRRDDIAEHLPVADDTSSTMAATLTQRGVPAALLNQMKITRDHASLASIELLWLALVGAPFVAGGNQAADRSNRWRRRQLRKSSAFMTLAHQHPLHADLVLTSLIRTFHPASVSQEDQMAWGGQAALPTLNPISPRNHLIGHGAPASIIQDTQRVPHYIIELLIRLDALIEGAGLVAVAVAGAQATNLQAIDRLRETGLWRDVCKFFGEDHYTTSGPTVMVLQGLIEHRQAGVGQLAYYQRSPLHVQLMAMGIPELVLRSQRRSTLPLIVALDQAVQAIAGNGALPAAQLIAVRALGGAHAVVMQRLDKYWLPVLGQLARHRGIATATDAQLDAGAHALDLLRPGAVALGAPQLGTITAPMSPLWLGRGHAMLQTNDAKYPTGLGGVMHGPSQALHALDPGEQSALNDYSTMAGMGIGAAGIGSWQNLLGAMDLTSAAPGTLRKNLPKIRLAVSGLNHLPVYGGTTYCGKSASYAGRSPASMQRVVKRYPIGRVLHADSFLSTAKTYGNSFAATKTGYDLCWVISNIRTGRDIQLVSTNDHEEEVLFAPGASFVVTQVVDDTHNTAGRPAKLLIHVSEVTAV